MSGYLHFLAGLRPSFGEPRLLILLALLPLVPLVARRSLAGLAGKRRVLAVAIRSAIVLALVLALAELEIRGKSDDLDVIFVLDRSLSLPPAAREAALRYVNEAAARADARRDRGTLVVFGRNAAIEGRVGPDGPISSPSAIVDPDGTDIAGALRLAAAAFREGTGRRVVLVSDGNETEGDALREAEALREAGAVLDVLPVHYRYAHEVLVERVVGPETARIGEPFTLRVTLRSTGDARGTLRLLEDDQVVGSEQVDLHAGANVFTFSRTAHDRGAHRFSAVIETPDDTLPGNNAAEHLVFVRGEGTTLYVAGRDGPTRPLLEALEAEKVRVRTVRASSLPADLGGYGDIDALILDNVAAEELDKQQMAVIDSAVHHLGIGLVMLGGDQSFGPGGYLGTPVEKALPVDMDVKQKKVIPKGALVMILHTCEFADGNVWAVRIASAAVDALSSQDEVGLIDYSNGAGGAWGEEWVFKLQQATDKAGLRAAIRRAQPGDMPSFETTVQMAHDGLAASVASLKHIIIITDADPQPPSPGLVRALVAKKITMSAVAINPHGGKNGPEVKNLENSAKATGGRFYFVDDPKTLPQIFTKEAVSVSRSLIVEEPFRAGPGVPSEVMKGLSTADLPPLKGYVMTTAKERAAVGLRTPQGDPLLAQWQYGVGKAAAFMSGASTRWGEAWIGWPGYKQFYNQLARAVAREVVDTPFDLQAEIVNGKGRIVLDAVDESGRFVNFLDVEAHIASPKLEHVKAKFEQTAPGRYEAHFDARESGTFFANVIAHGADGKIVAASGVAVENPYSLEYRKLASDERFMARLAEVGRGRVLTPEEPVFTHDVPAERAPREMWPFLLAVAVSLVPIDVAARRLAIDWARVRARVAAALGRRRAAASAAVDATMARLKSAKESAAAPAAKPKSAAGGLAERLHREGPSALPARPAHEPRPAPAIDRTPEAGKPPAEKPAASTDALARLLAAKKRARRQGGRAEMSAPRVDYGIDAPGVVIGLALAGAAGLALAAIARLAIAPRNPELGHALFSMGLRPGIGAGAGALLMIWGSRRGKLGLRDRLLDGLALGGDERVLDVGCGRGLLLIGAAKRLPRGRAVGIDLWQKRDQSGNDPAATLANARAEGVAERVDIQTGDMREMPFETGSFDAVVSSFAIHNVPGAAGRAKALAEIVRVLKPGGRLALLDVRCTRAYARILRQDLGMADVARSCLKFPFSVTPARVLTARRPTQ